MTEPIAAGPLGLSIASHSGLPAAAVGEIARAAEAAGFDSVFVAEGRGDASHSVTRSSPPRAWSGWAPP